MAEERRSDPLDVFKNKARIDLVDVSESECTLETAPHAVEKCNVHHCPARYNNYPVNLLFTQTCIYYGGSFPKLFQMECLRARAMLSSVRARRG